MSGDFLKKLGIEYPVILGPMGGGPSTPELVAAVSNAGGLGSFGAAYWTPGFIAEQIKAAKTLTSKPFNVNLFTAPPPAPPNVNPQAMLDIMAEVHGFLKIDPPAMPEPKPDPFPEQLEAVLADKPAIFSFTFGIPDAGLMKRIKSGRMFIIGTATTIEEAQQLEKAGVDAIALQGEEAGAHRGSFLRSFEESMVPIAELLQACVKAVSLPLIASGGIMDGRDIARMLALGASAVQMSTAFLSCPECGAPDAYKQAVLSAGHDTTTVTKVFSGRPARGLRNAFIERLLGHEDAILPYPLQNALTRPMRVAAAKQGDAGYLSLWAGRGVGRARQMPAAQLVATLVDEMKSAKNAQ